MLSPTAEATPPPKERDFPMPPAGREEAGDSDAGTHVREISMWLRALGSFFNTCNHPLAEGNQEGLVAQDWTNELRIARRAMLRASELVFRSVHFEQSDSTIFDEPEAAVTLDALPSPGPPEGMKTRVTDEALLALAASLGDACDLCQSLLEVRPVSLHAWVNLGQNLKRELGRLDGTKVLTRLHSRQETLNLPAPLLDLSREATGSPALAADMIHVFSGLYRLLGYLHFVETLLAGDQSLKQTLPVFTLVHEEARALTEFIKVRAMSDEGLHKHVVEALDSTSYAISMELRKVFAHELVGLSTLQQAPLIYAKVENAHGLLRDSFQQSVAGLAQVLDPSLDGAQLFDAFRTRLGQSLALRRDLWTLLQLVRRCEQKPETVERLLTTLAWFRDGSLRYLMFKDWESSERFMEEVDVARRRNELSPVLHRFTAYLEALSSQVNMRAVLINHPFDYPELQD
ncbi:MAG TPA: hypothetical protein VJT74_12680 [Pyrinomonadaceae bacterium]|nr:hypothetical protein [Pyrinomonadaceae bacterium]